MSPKTTIITDTKSIDEEISNGVMSSSEVISDKEGEAVGSWRDTQSQPIKKSSAVSSLSATSWEPTTEKQIIQHFYRKFGSGKGDDFELVSQKIVSAINRSFSKNVPITEVVALLDKYIDNEFLDSPAPSLSTSAPAQVLSKNMDFLREKKYDLAKGLPVLDCEKAELCSILACKQLCLSYKDGTILPACKISNREIIEDTLKEKGLDTCPLERPLKGKEQIMFEIFKDQVGEMKAKKLIILSRAI